MFVTPAEQFVLLVVLLGCPVPGGHEMEPGWVTEIPREFQFCRGKKKKKNIVAFKIVIIVLPENILRTFSSCRLDVGIFLLHYRDVYILQIMSSYVTNICGTLKENVLCEFLAPFYTSSSSMPPSALPYCGLLHFFIWGFFSTLYLRLHQAVTSKFSLQSCATLVYLFVLQPNAKPSLAVMSLIEDHSPEPSLEILNLRTSVRRECEVRQHKTFMYCLCWAFNKN